MYWFEFHPVIPYLAIWILCWSIWVRGAWSFESVPLDPVITPRLRCNPVSYESMLSICKVLALESTSAHVAIYRRGVLLHFLHHYKKVVTYSISTQRKAQYRPVYAGSILDLPCVVHSQSKPRCTPRPTYYECRCTMRSTPEYNSHKCKYFLPGQY